MAELNGKDLASESISEEENTELAGILAEESQRRTWKGRLILIIMLTIALLYIVFIVAVFCEKLNQLTHVIVALATTPTILSIALMKMLGKPNPSNEAEGMPASPVIVITDEIVTAIKDKFGIKL